MKKSFIFIIILLSCLVLLGKNDLQRQDALNREYLVAVDEDLISTIDLLTAFNATANSLPDQLEGARLFSKFLMECTMECSSMRKSVSESLTFNAEERDLLIRMLIEQINPGEDLKYRNVSEDRDIYNRSKLAVQNEELQKAIIEIQKKIVTEEKGIIESETFNKFFFNLHSRHFMFQLALDLSRPYQKLSASNRDFLLQVIEQLADIASKPIKLEE